jgi:photosystem II stability/assembly factor-like uncharacterized protein
MARQWRQGGIDGGGFITAVAVDPFGSGVLVCGGDVSGVHRSVNNGKRWTDRNGNRATVNGLKVACLKWHPTTTGLVYACVGLSGNGTWSGLYSSSDYGVTWSLLSPDVKFAANRNAASGIPSPWPRSTDSGSTWTTIALGTGPFYIRGITQDPAVPHRLFVATYTAGAGGVYRIDNADSGSPTVTQLTLSPPETEEIIVLNGVVYVAAGTGIFSKPSDTANDAWVSRLANGSKWTEITGNGTTLYAGAYKGILGGGGKYANIMRSTDGGATWTDILQTATISYTSYERSSPWWLAAANPLSMLGAKRYTCTQIEVDPTNPQRVFVVGTHGLWMTEDGGSNWRPALRELGVTIDQIVAVQGNNAIAADADWAFIRSNNLFLDQSGVSGKEVPKDGFSITSDSTNWYVGSGDGKTANQGGSVYTYANFTTLSRDSKWDLAGATSSAQDTFDRTVANGWGTSTLGGAWTAVSGANNRLSVTPAFGRIDTTQDNALHQQQLNGVSMTDCYAETVATFDRIPTGGWVEARIVLRADAAAANFYSGVLRLDQTGTLTLYIRKFNGTTYIIAQVIITDSYTPGTSIFGSTLILGNTITASGQLLSDLPEDVVTTTYADGGITQGPVITSGSPGLATTRQAGSSGAIITFGLSEWQSPTDTGIAGAWPIGMAAGKDASNNTILVAAAQSRGLWRKNVTTNSSWTLVSAACGITIPGNKRLPITWSTINADTLWAFDLNAGIYRSTDYGQTWALVSAATGDTNYYKGWIVADPTDGQVVWMVTDTGFYKVTNARSGTWTATLVNVATSPGPLALAPNGDIYLTDVTDGSPGSPPALWRSTDHGASWQDIADDTFRNAAIIPRSIAAKSDGTVLMATNGNAVIVYAPVGTKQAVT